MRRGLRFVGYVGCVACVGLFSATQTFAQVAPPAEPIRTSQAVVVTATVSPVSIDQVGRTVTWISREDLERLGITSLADAVRIVPGADPRARGPFGVQTDFSIRGATFGQSLVLVDGQRINDSQSGHHNGDIPVPMLALDHLEVVAGPTSSAHGADALGGALNFISRRDSHALVRVTAGEFGLAGFEASSAGYGLPAGWTTSAWGSRSRGFMFDRDFAMGGGMLRARPSPSWTFDVRHQRKAFGANGFYGASPSKEWTDQTIASLAWRRVHEGWMVSARGLARNHGDHFRWDIARPGFAENQHRTNAGEGDVTVERAFEGGRRITFGGSAGGDWVTSSNLGDHTYRRGAAFAEVLVPSSRVTLQGGVRVDGYSTFGHAISPSLAISTRLTKPLRLRVSIARAFRIPSFTERFYSDPANLGTPDLRPERGWSLDGGLDLGVRGWALTFSPFRRWDDDVIDWIRDTTADRWRSTNVRSVQTTGFEASISRRWKDALFRVYYAGLKVDAPSLNVLSKYVLEYARHQSGGSIAVPLVAGLRTAITVDHRHRLDGQEYDLVTLRFNRTFRRLDVFVEATNLLNEHYREVAGVDLPGRWALVGFRLGK